MSKQKERNGDCNRNGSKKKWFENGETFVDNKKSGPIRNGNRSVARGFDESIEIWNPQIVSKWQYIIPTIVMAILTAIFYWPSMRYAFQFDDIANIQKFFNIRHFGIKDLFFSGTRWISYWMNTVYYSISKFDPVSYRIGNLVIHTINGLLVFLILFTVLRYIKANNFFTRNSFSIAFFTALLFLLHPVQTQTVSYVIQGQLEGLAALSIFSMTFLFLKYAYSSNSFNKRVYLTMLFVFAAISCGTKEIAIMSPVMIMLADWFFVAQGSWKSFKSRILVHAAVSFVVLVLYLIFLKPMFFTEIIGLQRIARNNIGNIITHGGSDIITPWVFFISQFKVILHYLFIFIYPMNISVEYDWVLSKSFFAPDCIFPLLGLLAIFSVIFVLLKKNKASIWAFGLVWFFIAIAPRSSIIPSPELLVDYKTYTASLGWLFLLSCAFIFAIEYIAKKIFGFIKLGSSRESGVDLSGEKGGVSFDAIIRGNRRTGFVLSQVFVTIAVAIFAGFLTVDRNTIWRSGQEFWGDMIKHAPAKARAYNNYGVELSQNLKDFKGAIPYFKKAIEMDSNYPDPWNNLAVSYANVNDLDNAINALNESIKIYPYYPENYNNLASFYLQKNELDRAEKLLHTAIKLRSYYGKAFFNLGRVYYARNDFENAWINFKKCCTECDFDNVPHGFAVYGRVSVMLKKYDEAIFAYEKALSFEPVVSQQDFDYREAVFSLANTYHIVQKYDKAIALYEKIVQSDPRDLRSWFNMGESLMASDRCDKALQCYQKASPIKGKLPYFNVRLANCLEKLGRYQEAQQVIDFFMIECNNNICICDNKTMQEARVLAHNLSGKIKHKSLES